MEDVQSHFSRMLASEAHSYTFYSNLRWLEMARKWNSHDSNSDSNTSAWEIVILGKEEEQEDSVNTLMSFGGRILELHNIK